MGMRIRQVQKSDAEAILAIYGPVIQNTVISFEFDVPTIGEMETRIDQANEQFPWFVMETSAQICGYVYASPFRARIAYQHSVETTVYIHSDHHRQGIGLRLMRHLLTALKSNGSRRDCRDYSSQ